MQRSPTRYANEAGACYPFAVWFATDYTSAVVVHGTIYDGNLNRRIKHAWCVLDLVVYDNLRPNGILWPAFLEVFQPEPDDEYGALEAVGLAVRTMCYGPWDEDER